MEEGMQYVKEWPNLPVDLDFFKNYFEDKLLEIEINAKSNPEFTNHQAVVLIKLNTLMEENDEKQTTDNNRSPIHS